MSRVRAPSLTRMGTRSTFGAPRHVAGAGRRHVPRRASKGMDGAGSDHAVPLPGRPREVENTLVQVQRLSAAEAVNMVAELASELVDTPSLEELLERALSLATDIVPGCEQAGISLLQDRVVDTPASFGELAAMCDRLQEQLGDGPCVTAL